MTRIGSRSWCLLALLVPALWLAPAIAHADPTVQMDVNPTEVQPGDEAFVTVTVTNAPGGSLKNFSFGDLQVAGGPSVNQQQTIMFSNGAANQQSSMIYTWRVVVPREGVFKIGPAVVDMGGKQLSSEPVEIRCSKNATPRPQARRRANPFGVNPFDPLDDFDSFFGGPVRRPVGNSDVFLKAVVDKTEPYLGEQVTLSLYLFAITDVSGVSSVSFPKLDGFWAEDTEAPTQLTGELRNVDNQVYHVYLLRRRALFPLRAGELTIDPVEAQINLALGIDPFSAGEPVKRRSSSIKLNVKPLPANGQPPKFESTNVGNFNLSATLTPQVGSLGQPLQLKVLLDGIGNIKSVSVPKPMLPEGLKTYDPTVTDKVHISSQKYGGTKSIEWVIIPERTGDFQIPPIELPYFDPGKQTYETARTQPIAVHVAGPATAIGSSTSGQVQAPTAINVLDSGIRPIRLQAELTAAARPVWQRGFFWPLALLPVLLFGFLWGGSSAASAWKNRDPEQLRIRRAHSAASRRLKTAREQLQANDANNFYAEVMRALQQFVTDKTGVQALGLTREELGKALVERGFPAEQVSALVKILETCETARFSPTARSSSTMSSVLDQSQQVLDALERVRASRAA